MFIGSTLGRIAVTRARDGSLAKGGLNGGHRPPLPCDLPMGGFPYEFGPETERKIPGAWHRLFSAHRLEGRFSDPRPHLEAPAASSRRATRPKISKGAPLGHGGHLPARPTGGPWEEARPGPLLPRHPLPCAPRPVPRLAGNKKNLKQACENKLALSQARERQALELLRC